MSSEELKPCPFCLREAQQTASSGLVSCAHEDCPAFLLAVPAADWNTRAQLAAIQGGMGEVVAWGVLCDGKITSATVERYDLRHGCEWVPLCDQRITAAMVAEVEKARRRAEYWKQEHLAGNAVIEQLRTTLDLARQAIERADFTTGVCACGGYLNMHSACDNHAPVDGGTAYKLMVVKAIDDAFLFQPAEVKP